MMQLSLHIGSRRQSLSPRSTCRNNCQLSTHDLGRSHDRRTLEGRGTFSEKTDKTVVKGVKLRRSLQGKCTEIPDRTVLCSLFCAVVSGLVYVNSLDGELVHDDLSAIRDNPDVVDSVWIFDLFRNDFWGMPMRNPESHKSYRPLTTLTFRLNYVFHGFAPRGYHVVNILLHAITTALFVDTAVRCLESSLLSATIAGVLFAIHPVHTEAVSGIVGRADILATLFFILSFRAYYSCIRSDGDGAKQRHHRLKSVLLAGISMLCKEHGLTVIAVSSLWDVIISKHSLIRTLISTGARREESGNFTKPQMNPLRRAISLISMGIPLLLFRIWIMGSELPNFSDQENPAAASPFLLTRFLTWFYLPVLNLFLLFCPVWLSYDWQLGTVALVESVMDVRFTLATLVYLSLATLAWKLMLSGKPADIWCLLTLIMPFLPAANIIAPVGFVLAERLLYLPSLGFCLLVGQGFDRLWNRFHLRGLKISLLLSITFILVVFCGKTWTRNVDWLSRETLFRSGLKSFPCNAKMHYNFANLQKDEGRPEAAVLHYQEALRLWPSHASAHNNLGTLLSDLEAAKVHFEEALKIHPRHANALYNLAAIHRKGGNTTTAVRLLESCLKVEPFHKEALMMMADILTDKGDIRRVYIVNLFIKEAHRRRGKRQTETSELWNNLSRTVDAPLRHNGEPPNILQYLNANHVDGKRHVEKVFEVTPKLLQVKPTRTLTTEDGRPLSNKTAVLSVGPKGPALLIDHVFLEENAHFNREMVPDRIVHAKGAGAFGQFTVTHDITKYTKAKIFSEVGKTTPLAVRFSVVVTNTGTPDSARDVRGFAIKFYTEEGNWDLVGNNFPIFWIRDPMQFPSLIHCLRANPVTGLRAPDAFWDFVSLRPETMHQLLMVYSDRGIPLNYRHMHGFGINTFVLVNKDDESVFCKFHYLSNQGIKNMLVEDVPMYAAGDPDHARRDLYNAIAEGNHPSWTLYIQVMTLEQFMEKRDFDPLDDTKAWPHKDFPLIEVGKIVLNRNPTNFHGEVEQIAFCPANIVPGIEHSLDKILQGRIFSYPDTQRYRIGPNFKELPVNSPLFSPPNNYLIKGPMNAKYENKDGPTYFPNTFSGPQPVEGKEFFAQECNVTGRVGRYDNWDENNFGQAKVFYEKVLKTEEQMRLIANIAESLQHSSSMTQNKMIEHFKEVNEEFSAKVKEALDKREKLRQEGKTTMKE